MFREGDENVFSRLSKFSRKFSRTRNLHFNGPDHNPQYNLMMQTKCDGCGAPDQSFEAGRQSRPHGTLSAPLTK